MIERWWEGQYLQKVIGKLTKRGKERDKQEMELKKKVPTCFLSALLLYI